MNENVSVFISNISTKRMISLKHIENTIMVNSPAQDSSQESQMVVEKKPTCRPDSCWSWVVCVASVILVIIVSGIGYSFGLLLPPLMESFGASRQSTGNGNIKNIEQF